MKARAGSKALIREINEALVLDAVRSGGTVSRAAIATRTSLSPATVTGITGALIQRGMLTETDVVRDTGGRPARLLSLGTDTLFAAGVRLGAHDAHIELVDLAGRTVASHREAWEGGSGEDAAAAIDRGLTAIMTGRPGAALLGAGVAVSGLVDHARGRVRHSGALGWTDVPLGDLLSAHRAVPVLVDSYVNAFAWSGILDAGPDHGDLLVFSVGTSIGAAMILQGRIHRGFGGRSGGFAHWRAGGDRPCHCGATGCLETWSSRWGMERRLAESDAETTVIADAGLRLGQAMANAVKLVRPERVLLAFAPEMDFAELPRLTAAAFRADFAHEQLEPELRTAVADASAVARGAAAEILAGVFTADRAQDAENSVGD